MVFCTVCGVVVGSDPSESLEDLPSRDYMQIDFQHEVRAIQSSATVSTVQDFDNGWRIADGPDDSLTIWSGGYGE